MKATIVIRIYYRDWIKLRKVFKAERNESACSYIKRLAIVLENNYIKKLIENEKRI